MKTHHRLALMMLTALVPLFSNASEELNSQGSLQGMLAPTLVQHNGALLAHDDTGRTLYDRNKRRVEERQRRYYRNRSQGQNYKGQWPYYNPRYLDAHAPDTECVENCKVPQNDANGLRDYEEFDEHSDDANSSTSSPDFFKE